MATNGWFTPEEQAQQARDHNAMLVERFKAGLPMPKLDKREARKLIREAEAFEKQRQTLS